MSNLSMSYLSMSYFDDFKKRCSTVCELLKTIEYLEPNQTKKAFLEDAYFILDHLVAQEYSDVQYSYPAKNILKLILFHDLPKHRSDEKYYEDFIKAYMPNYDERELKERYLSILPSSFSREELMDFRVNCLKIVVERYIEPAFGWVQNL